MNAPPTRVDDSNPAVLASLLQAELGPIKGSQLAKAGLPAIIGPNALAFRFEAGYHSAYEQCADERSVALAQSALRKMTGADWQVRMELLPPTAKATAEPAAQAPVRSQRDELLAQPLFRKAVTALGAQLVKLDEGFQAVTLAIDDEEPTEV